MNIEQAKTMVDDQIKKPKYFLSKENDIYGIKGFVATTAGCGLLLFPGFVNHPVITSIGVVTLGVTMNKLIDFSHSYTKEEKLQMKKEYYGYKMLKNYKRQLKNGNNPLESIEFSKEAFNEKLNNDVNLKHTKVLCKK